MARAGAARAGFAEGERIGDRYVVEATLGRGGMGAVHRVRDDATGRVVALKQMTWGGSGEGAKLRFRREFHTMASLRHPRIVEVYDYGVADGTPYYTLELLDGQDLHDLDRVPWRRACALLRDVATALGFLHTRRLLHRDLAPRNVRCTSDGRAKLIDFGVLATTGIVGDIAGTPPFVAPEGVRGRPLDHRYDLFGLGALAYRILTGRHAYPARSIEELEAEWRHRPAPPSSIAPDVPPALDELVSELLAHDPLARPPGAAEVIDRLTAIGGLERPTEVGASQGWIASAALIGRQREIAQIRRAVVRAHATASRSVLIEAPSGIGKTRLLRELALEAQLAGTCVVQTDSEAAGRGPYGIFHELARGLIAAIPDDALTAARPRAAMLARVITSLRDRLGVKPHKPLGDPAEDRMRLQHELVAWILDLAARRPIALLVDDIQRCDEASAAVLAALAHGAEHRKLLVGVALRTDEPVRAPAPIAALCDAGQRLRLRGLDEAQLGELCRSLFGDVQHVPRLAQWMHKVAGGSPLYATELARHLVDRGVIRYVDGLWVVPEEPGREDLPQGLIEAMDARVRSLPAEARALGEALSVHGGELGLDLIVALAGDDTDRVFAALDRLAFEEVLVQSGDGWRFRHDGLREALLRGLDDDRRRALHLRVGEVLAKRASAGDRGAERDAEIGWHLLRGGDAEHAVLPLERAGRALYASQSFADSIPPLEAVLEVRGRGEVPARVRLELLQTIVMAGVMADRNATLRHADACIAGYGYWAGIDVATRVGAVFGKYLGIVVGLLWALARWLGRLGRGPNPYEAFRTYFIVVGYSASVYSLAFDTANTLRLVELVDPIAILKNRVPYGAYLLARNLYHFPRGDFEICRRNAIRTIDILEHDRLVPMREIDRRTGIGGARYMLAMIAVVNLEPDALAQLDALGRCGLRFYEVGAEQARVAFHRLRGEEEAAAEIETRVELMFVQLGSLWMMEAFTWAISTFAYGIARDTLGLRRTIERLAALCANGLRYEPFLQLARGEYLRERGDLVGALAELELLVARAELALLHTATLPALAETLIATGDFARAKVTAARGVALASPFETYTVHGKLRSVRALALAEAALGNHDVAAKLLDDALAEAAPHDSPLLSGVLHEARARVALAAGDSLAFYHHLAETNRLFRRTRNPALLARGERLVEAGLQSESRAPTDGDDAVATSASSPRGARRRRIDAVTSDAVTTPPPPDLHGWVSGVLSGCRGASERAVHALEMIVAEARGASGYLYLRRAEGLVLVAPAVGDEPPAELARMLASAIDRDAPTAVDGPSTALPPAPSGWRPFVLAFELAGEGSIVVGVAAVLPGALPVVEPSRDLLAELAHELFDAGDVSQTRVEPD